MAINWGGQGGTGFADFIRQYDPMQGQQATFGANPPRQTTADPTGSLPAPTSSNWWDVSPHNPANPVPRPDQGAYAGAPPSPYGGDRGPGRPGPYSAPPPPGYAPTANGQGYWQAPAQQPGQANGSYFPNDPNNPLTTAARAQYDLNPTLAWQRVVGQTVSNPNSPQYAWARAQYQRYYQDYVQANGMNPNLTFTTYLDQRAPQLAQEFGNAPASARGVNNTWLTSGRFTS